MAKIEICRENLEFVLDGRGVLAGFSTRLGGVSGGAYASLNLGDHVGDDPQNVAQNREILTAKVLRAEILLVKSRAARISAVQARAG